jgi:CheY-like chemotaxis protein
MLNSQATLLIVDDESSIRHSLSQSLTEMSYSVRTAGDGFSALREIRNEVPKFLLSDLNMPGMSGFELLGVVRRRFPAIRTIAMSGSFSGDEVPSGVAADAFFQKGSSILALMRIMENLPGTVRPFYPPSSPEAPLWIHCNHHDLSPDEQVIITCPECLRTFSQTLGADQQKCMAECIYCHSSIHYVIARHADRMPLQRYQRKAAAADRVPQCATNPSY